MIATFDKQDYQITLQGADNNILRLPSGKLTATLEEHGSFENLGKVVRLELVENKGTDGIELQYLPEGTGGWNEVEEILVRMNNSAYQKVRERGKFGTRYNGSDKIEILDEVLNRHRI